MKKIFTLLLMIPLILACSSSDNEKINQKLWLQGCVDDFGTSKNAIINFYFFDPKDVKDFKAERISTNLNESDYYDYSNLEYEKVYKTLVERRGLLLPSGSIIQPKFSYTSNSGDTLKEVVIPTGDYFVVVFIDAETHSKKYHRNKYSCLSYTLESRYSPQHLAVTIPLDLTFIGAFDWSF